MWKMQSVDTDYHGEGAAFGDLNRDGQLDLVSGPYWYAGPEFTTRHPYYAPNPKDPNQNGYTNDNFLVFVGDFNGDDWNDIFVVAFPGTTGHWFENPQGATGHWRKHLALNQVGNESPTLFPFKAPHRWALACVHQGNFGLALQDPENPTAPWRFSPVSDSLKLSPFTHGLGVGDLNGDGHVDLLTKDGWFQQPIPLTLDQPWRFHRYDLRPNRRLPFPGGAQIHADDIDGDGDTDFIMSLAAHGYGLAWFEQRTEVGTPVFYQHNLLNQDAKPNPDGIQFSQLHALEIADLNGDGLKDIITGKCRFAHGPAGDPDPQGDPVVYGWLAQRQKGTASFEPVLLSRTAGVGRQIAVGDVDGDGRIELGIGNKVGTSLIRHP